MPIYEYLCGNCGHRFEKLVRRFGEQVRCPGCAGLTLEKQLSVFAVASAAPRPGATPCPAAADCREGGCAAGSCGDGCGYAD